MRAKQPKAHGRSSLPNLHCPWFSGLAAGVSAGVLNSSYEEEEEEDDEL